MAIPTVNLVISEDFSLMKTFLETKSLARFKEEVKNRKDDTTIFLTNTLNSGYECY